ncbi:unnamed protein product [Orchesella dallaii]|uniref:L-xylulose reductase n=1 Tax=Orchesella dallaii TaxID=48710 RepID=A0ABP1R7G2_9HEXA
MSNYKDLKYLVTGAGRGIGRALVAELHSQGATVYALSKNPENLKKLKEEFPSVIPISVDLANVDEIKKALEPIEAVDCVINNAGIVEHTEFLTATPESFDRQFNVNLKAVMFVSQIMAKKMIEKGKGGSIVNMSSISAGRPDPGCAIYACTKAGVDMLTRAMAVELGPHKIRVNSVNPGNVLTDMNQPRPDGKEDVGHSFILNRTPTGELWMPMRDIVNTTLFLASNLTSQLTGQCIAVDGGYLAN